MNVNSWGPMYWEALRSAILAGQLAADNVVFLGRWLPCRLCRESIVGFLGEVPPPRQGSKNARRAWLMWLSRIHNCVNRKLVTRPEKDTPENLADWERQVQRKHIWSEQEMDAWVARQEKENRIDHATWIQAGWDMLFLWIFLWDPKDKDCTGHLDALRAFVEEHSHAFLAPDAVDRACLEAFIDGIRNDMSRFELILAFYLQVYLPSCGDGMGERGGEVGGYGAMEYTEMMVRYASARAFKCGDLSCL